MSYLVRNKALYEDCCRLWLGSNRIGSQMSGEVGE